MRLWLSCYNGISITWVGEKILVHNNLFRGQKIVSSTSAFAVFDMQSNDGALFWSKYIQKQILLSNYNCNFGHEDNIIVKFGVENQKIYAKPVLQCDTGMYVSLKSLSYSTENKASGKGYWNGVCFLIYILYISLLLYSFTLDISLLLQTYYTDIFRKNCYCIKLNIQHNKKYFKQKLLIAWHPYFPYWTLKKR